MVQAFADNTFYRFEGVSEVLRIESMLGAGSQGQVYKAYLGEDSYALKWYFPGYIKRDRDLHERLTRAVSIGAPNKKFIWPSTIVRARSGKAADTISEVGFGYLMPLRPKGFVSATEHYGGLVETTIQNILIACKGLCSAYHALHTRGFCYKDLSLGNIFLNPGNGGLLVCDNDNADVNGRKSGSVLGTPGFIAPEILTQRVSPNFETDLFSLANVIFRLMMRHDPYCGKQELSIPVMDTAARMQLYSKNAVFIFDPENSTNRPDQVVHAGANLMWTIYTDEIRRLFIRSLGKGLSSPAERVLTGEWIDGLSELLNRRCLCKGCDSEVFMEESKNARTCWNCGERVTADKYLDVGGSKIIISPGTSITESHFRKYSYGEDDLEIAKVIRKDDDTRIIGLRNCSAHDWRAVLMSGKTVMVSGGQTCSLSALSEMHTHVGLIRVYTV